MARSNYCLEISKVRERLKISGPFQSSEILAWSFSTCFPTTDYYQNIAIIVKKKGHLKISV